MATIAIPISKNLHERLGDEGTQEIVSILNQINTAQLEEMERLNGRTFEKFQQELALVREQLGNQIERVSLAFDKKLADQRANLLKWMFIFWSTTIITIVAGYILK
ncbi:MAG: hypothetical protein ONB44_02405 [candidate division KSB1 bacterium]|nr:hypothetical protein [candidate division KSB1 bacterium]MDZ7300976.1 hypothetical protein [candidate division KSB1 bacterium]MDZ7310346.1 hypothetical protein [candidate division KSB1 bacterium]